MCIFIVEGIKPYDAHLLQSRRYTVHLNYNDDKISDFLKKKYPPLVDKVRRGEYFAGGAEYYYKDIINMTN